MAAPTVSTAAVTSITGTSAVSGGSVVDDGGKTAVLYGVCWNTTGSPTTSDSHTSESSLLLPLYDLADYGAVGDGVTDDTTAIRAAVTAAGVSGGTIYFTPDSTYRITGTIKLPPENESELMFFGEGASVVLDGASGFLEFQDSADYQNFRYFTVRGLDLDATLRSATAGFYFIGAYNAFGNFYPKRGNVEYINLRDLTIHGAPSLDGAGQIAAAICLGTKQGALKGQTAADAVTENTTNYVRHIEIDNVHIEGGDSGILVCSELSAAVANVAPVPSDTAMEVDDITISNIYFDSGKRPPFPVTYMNCGIQVGVWGRVGTVNIRDCYLRGSADNLLELDNPQVANVTNVQCVEDRNHAFTLTRFGYPLDAVAGVDEGSMTVTYTDCSYDEGASSSGEGWGFDYDEVLNHVAHPTYNVTYAGCTTIRANDSVVSHDAPVFADGALTTGAVTGDGDGTSTANSDLLAIALSASHASIGDQLTITCNGGFGTTQGTSEVYFGEAQVTTPSATGDVTWAPCTKEAASYVSWSDTAITVTVPSMSPGKAGATGTYHKVRVYIGGVESAPADFYIDPVRTISTASSTAQVDAVLDRTFSWDAATGTITTSDGSGNVLVYNGGANNTLFDGITFVATNTAIGSDTDGVVTLYSTGLYNCTFHNCTFASNTGGGTPTAFWPGVNGVKAVGSTHDHTFSACTFESVSRMSFECMGGSNFAIKDCTFEPAGNQCISYGATGTNVYSITENCLFKGWGNDATLYPSGAQCWESNGNRYIVTKGCTLWSGGGEPFNLSNLSASACHLYFENIDVHLETAYRYQANNPLPGGSFFASNGCMYSVWRECTFNTGDATNQVRYLGQTWNGNWWGNAAQNNYNDFTGCTVTGYVRGAANGTAFIPSTSLGYWDESAPVAAGNIIPTKV